MLWAVLASPCPPWQGQLRQHWLVLQAGLSSDRTPPTPIQPRRKATPTQVLLFHTSAELPWSQAGGPLCMSRRGVEPERRELCSKEPRLSLGLQRSSSLGCLPLKVQSPWLLAAHRAGSPKAQWAEPSRLHSGFPGMQVGGASHSCPVFSQQL